MLAKAEDACLREKMSGAERNVLFALRVSKGHSALWRPSSVTSWDAPRSDIKTAQRGAELYARQKKKLYKIQLNFLQLRSRTLTLLRAFADSVYVLSLSLNKERTKESQPKAAAFGNCSFAALQRRLGRKTYTLSLHLPPFSHHERQA